MFGEKRSRKAIMKSVISLVMVVFMVVTGVPGTSVITEAAGITYNVNHVGGGGYTASISYTEDGQTKTLSTGYVMASGGVLKAANADMYLTIDNGNETHYAKNSTKTLDKDYALTSCGDWGGIASAVKIETPKINSLTANNKSVQKTSVTGGMGNQLVTVKGNVSDSNYSNFKKVKCSITSGSDKVALYSNYACTTPITESDEVLYNEVYVKGLELGEATIKFTSAYDDTKTAEATITVTERKYNIWVGGTQVTSEALSGDGWEFAPDSWTLTLNNYNNNGAVYVNGSRAAAIYSSQYEPFNIILNGSNVINVSDDTNECSGVSVPHILNISGSGSLQVTASGQKSYGINTGYYAITLGGNITVTSDNIGVKGSTVTLSSGNIVINGGSSGGYAVAKQSSASGKLSISSDVSSVVLAGGAAATDLNVVNYVDGFGWGTFDGSGDKSVIKAVDEGSEGETLVYQRIAFPSATMSYDANGGSGTMTDSNNPYAPGSTVTVLDNSFVAPEGKIFSSWNTAADGTGTSYVKDDTFTISGSTTLYAQWEATPSITLDKDSLTLRAGDDGTIVATTIPDKQTVTWSSDKPAVATVDTTGKITAVEKGTANITAAFTYKNVEYKKVCAVTVDEKPSVTLDATSASVSVGDTKTLTATTVPADQTVTWSSDKEAVATVDNTGKVTAKEEGTAKITAKITVGDKDYTAECEVTVTTETTPKVELNKSTLNLTVNEESTLTATTVPADQTVTWSSTNTDVATVDSTGKVTAKSAGTTKVAATITVEGREYKAECDVTVTAAPTPTTPGVVIDIDTMVMRVNEEEQIAVTVVPQGTPVTWTSSEPTIVSVDSTGKVKGLLPGRSTITATITVGSDTYSDEFTVVVSEVPVPTGVTVAPTSLDLVVGGGRQLEVETIPVGATVTFTSNNEAVATVDDGGIVTAMAPGNAVISASITVDDTLYTGTCAVTVTAESGQSETIVVPEALSDDNLSPEIIERYGSAERVTLRLEEVMSVTPESRANSRVYDARVMVITDQGERPATADDITPEGLEAIFPYPDGTNKDDYTFSGAHMMGESGAGYQAGDIEQLSFTNGEDGLHTRVHGLSPVIITWTRVEPGTVVETDAHVHVYAWDTIQATADQDGEMRYQCRICGDIQTRVPITAYYIFNKETTEKIRRAKQGETVKIETARWISFHKMVMEALAERPDVTLEVSFLDEGHKGARKTFTIPAGTTDLTSLVDDKGFAGFIYLAGKFGNTVSGN